MKTYEKYKPSGFDWIGDIPANWKQKRLKYFARINPTDPNSNLDKSSAEEVVFLRMESVSEDGQIDQSERVRINEASSGFTYFRKGDVILAKITPCFENGKGSYLKDLETEIGFGSTEFHTIRAESNLSPSFLFYVTKSNGFKAVGEALMKGAAGQKRVTKEFVQDYPTALPSLSEQTAIADYLDKETARIDELIGKKKRLIELLKEERLAIINQAVTRGLDPNAQLKPSNIELLGDIPEHWEVKKLKYVAQLKSGDGITSESIQEEGEYPVFGGNGFRGYFSSFTHDGDFVLVGRQGALCGNIKYASGKFWASDHAVVVTMVEDNELKWLGELLTVMNLNQYSQSAAQPGLSVEMIKNLSIPVPPITEQMKLAEFIRSEAVKIDATVLTIEKEIGLLNEYRTALISEVVTGKLKVA
jgi:type I restriction enzyme, S subunit